MMMKIAFYVNELKMAQMGFFEIYWKTFKGLTDVPKFIFYEANLN